MTSAEFTVTLENDRLLNGVEFVFFLCQHQHQTIVLTVNNEGHCCDYNGIYNILDKFDFRSVRIVTNNALEQHDKYEIDNSAWPIWLDHTQGFDFDFDYEWDQSKIFGCIFARPSAPRLGLAAYLAKHYPDQALILHKFDNQIPDSRALFDIARLFSWHPESVQNYLSMPNFTNIYEYRKGTWQWHNPISQSYKSFMIEIVSEPVCEGRSFYPTEKIVRCILCRRPFIVMASRNYLDYLHQMGFYSFCEFWDESYDGLDGADRYRKILHLIDHLAGKSKKQLIDIYYSAKFFVDHNFDLLTSKKFSRDIQPL